MEILALLCFWFFVLKPRLQRIEKCLGLDYTLSADEINKELRECAD